MRARRGINGYHKGFHRVRRTSGRRIDMGAAQKKSCGGNEEESATHCINLPRRVHRILKGMENQVNGLPSRKEEFAFSKEK